MGQFRFAAAASLALGLALAAPASATTWDLDLTGSVGNTVSGSFPFPGGITIGFGFLVLSGLPDDFEISQGDSINVTVTLDGLFTVPASVPAPGFSQFFGFDFLKDENPLGASVSGEYTLFTDLFGNITVPLSGGCGNCLNLIAAGDGTPWGFTGFTATLFVDTLDEPFAPFDASISYQVVLENLGEPGVIPEPAIWAMLITGFGMVGAGLRRRRMAVTLA